MTYFNRDGTVVLTGGQKLRKVHSPIRCEGRHCCIHWPSNHHMVGWEMQFAEGYMNRVCQHGQQHPDPDNYPKNWWPHNCDSCCNPASQTGEVWEV